MAIAGTVKPTMSEFPAGRLAAMTVTFMSSK